MVVGVTAPSLAETGSPLPIAPWHNRREISIYRMGKKMAVTQPFRQKRRQALIRAGKRITRLVDRFLASQSLLGDPPIFDTSDFPWVGLLEERWEAIREEGERLLQERELIPAFHQISPDQKRISKGDAWKTFFLYGFGRRSETACRRCPETAKILEQIPGMLTAWFSILAPGYHIPPHRGPTKSFLVCHLGLIVPKEREKCYLRVEDHILHWEEGKCFIFDDTFEHEVRNETDEYRVVLLLHVERPMRWPGKLAARFWLNLIKLSPYFKDGYRNMKRWEERYEAALQNLK